MDGKAVLTEPPGIPQDRLAATPARNKRRAFLDRIARLGPSAIVAIERGVCPAADYFNTNGLRHPEFEGPGLDWSPPLRISLYDAGAAAAFDAMPAELAEASFSLHVDPPAQKEAVLRNVVGVLRGSDPVLKDTYVLLSAHYDHIGVRPNAEGDK